MTEQDPRDHTGEADAIADGEIVQHIPVSVASFGLGICGLTIGVMTWVPQLYLMMYVSLPLALLLFLFTAFLSLGAAAEGEKAFLGVLFAMAGVVLPCIQLLVDPSHPWIAGS